MSTIEECLNEFCLIYGQKVSLQKSNLFFSRGVVKALVEKIASVAQIPITTNLENTLGTLKSMVKRI